MRRALSEAEVLQAAREGDRAAFDALVPPSARGVFRMVPVSANGEQGFGVYAKDEQGAYRANAIHVLRFTSGKLVEITAFLDARLFPLFGLGETLA